MTQAEPGQPKRVSAALALEFVSIVVGVLLALGLSQWAEDREHRQLADAALVNIYSELASNQRTLQIIHENNKATVEAIETAADDGADRSFIPGMQLQDTAWNTFLSTGLSAYVEYETVLELSKLYSIQNIYKQTGLQLIEASMTASAVAVASGTEIADDRYADEFLDYFTMLTQVEAQLLDAYQTGQPAAAD